MTKIHLILMLIFSLTFVSCGKGGSGGGGNPSAASSTESGAYEEDVDTVTGTVGTTPDDTSNTTIKAVSNLPAKALSFATNISLMNFTSAQKAKYNAAIAIVKKVVRTDSFRSKVLNFKYNGIKQFANNKGLTNSQIYQTILDAAETLKPIKNNTMDLGVKLYYAANTVVGFTNPSITYINVNTKFFNSFTANQVAGNLFHEWLHKIGYDHDFSATARRPYSVPYAIGYIVRDIGKNFL